jgi:hypothetical protein
LDELQQQYAELQKENEQIQERQRIIEQQKREQEALIAKLNYAATKIQSLFRGYLDRKKMKVWIVLTV